MLPRFQKHPDLVPVMEEFDNGLPPPKRVCLSGPEGSPGVDLRASEPVGCSTPEYKLDLSDMSFAESFIEDVEEEQRKGTAAAPVSPASLDQNNSEPLDINEEYYKSFIEEVEEDQLLSQQSDREVECGSCVSSSGLVLPREVLENVLSRLGMTDLYTSAILVCQLWKDIITHESFTKFKKFYHGLEVKLSSPIPSDSFILRGCIEFVRSEFSHIQTDLRPVLVKHPQYRHSASLYNQDQQELTSVQELVLLVVCCKSVHQLLHLVRLLSSPLTGGFSAPALSYSEISELLYCLAKLFKTMTPISPRFHYCLYYVLKFLERKNKVSVISEECSEGYSATTGAKLTSQQLKIVGHQFEDGQTIKVLALAGTGKTTTLYHIAKANPRLRFLYCAYNKSVQQHAYESIFADCRNVKCKTLHGLAFPHTGVLYENKFAPNLQANYISWKIDLRLSLSKKICLAMCVRDTLDNYFSSADEDLEEKHVQNSSISYTFEEDDILSESRKYWNEMKSFDNRKVRMTHDGYFKLYQLSKPSLEAYDVILVDEAQDLSPALVDILTRQPVAKVFVGDPNQQIYSFRGAINALSEITATHTYHLSRSFRFGPEISYACELVLSHFKKNKTQTLIGTLQKGSITGEEEMEPMAVISRLNSTLFDEVATVIKSVPDVRIAFTGVAEMKDLDIKYNFDMLEDLVALKSGKDPKSLKRPEIKWGCKSYSDLVLKANLTEDVAMLGRINVCDKYFRELPGLIKKIKERIVFDFSKTDWIFSTAHRSKGLEFDSVVVTDDFTTDLTKTVDFVNDDGSIETRVVPVEPDEHNLVYVAMSRAKHNLTISPSILSVLKVKCEKFCYPGQLASNRKLCQMLSKQAGRFCHSCQKNLPFLLAMPTFQLSDNSLVFKESMCAECCQESILKPLYINSSPQ